MSVDRFSIAGQHIEPGQRCRVVIHTAALYDFTPMSITIEVIRGKEPGPILFVCAALHGDEINGVDIVRQLLSHKSLRHIKGTLIAIPIVNVFGFNTKSRYLPDRRDLNRCFPGSEQGSLASQLAHLLMEEVISKTTHGIDLHTGAIHRSNIPQIRGCFDDAETKRLAEAFGAPVMIHSNLRDGSLRQAAKELGIPILLFEGGEALRFHQSVTRVAVRGIINVMQSIDMIDCKDGICHKQEVFHAHDSHWLRAPCSGIFQVKKKLGDRVLTGQLIGVISDPFGLHHSNIYAKHEGMVIGMSMIPLFNKGDAIFHIATFEDVERLEEELESHAFASHETFIT